MFRYIATIPPSNLAAASGSVTIEKNSFILNDDGCPIYYHFHLICTDFKDYCNQKNIKNGKNYILLTIHTKDNPVTPNILASNFFSFMNVYVQINQINNFQITTADQESPMFSSVKDASNYVQQYFSDQSINFMNEIITLKINSSQTFTWIILPFSNTNDKNDPNNFISCLKGSQNIESEEFDEFKSLIQHSVILVNYRFSLASPFKFIKKLLKLTENFEDFSVDPQISKSAPNQSPKVANDEDKDEDENEARDTVEFEYDPNFDWKEFIKKKDHIGFIRDMNEKKRIERELAQKNMNTPDNINKNFTPRQKPDRIDKQKLVFVAQKFAHTKNVPIETMDEVIKELDTQLKSLSDYESKSEKRIADLGKVYKHYVNEKKKMEEKFEEAKREYRRIHKELETRQTIKRDEKIGFDDDVDFTIELLEEEIDAIKKEIEYLKAAFPDSNDEEEENVIEEEEEEEVVEEEEENDNVDNNENNDSEKEIVEEEEYD